MINVEITSPGGTLIFDLPRSSYDVMGKLLSIGIRKAPSQINLHKEADSDFQIRLFSQNKTGENLLDLCGSCDTLDTLNKSAYMIKQCSDKRIINDVFRNMERGYYHSCNQVIIDIQRMTYESGSICKKYYCPLEGILDKSNSDYELVENRYLRDYQWAIEGLLRKEESFDPLNMVTYFNDDVQLKNKLCSIRWGVESVQGKLLGTITCRLKADISDKEEDILKDWITGQNADGWGEHFEQQPIETEDGQLYVSYWNDGDDYDLVSEEDLDEFIDEMYLRIEGI